MPARHAANYTKCLERAVKKHDATGQLEIVPPGGETDGETIYIKVPPAQLFESKAEQHVRSLLRSRADGNAKVAR